MKLPKKVIPNDYKAMGLLFGLLCIIFVPLFLFSVAMGFHGFVNEEKISLGIWVSTLVFGGFPTWWFLTMKKRMKPLILKNSGFQVLGAWGQFSRFFNWSEISYIDSRRLKGNRLICLHLKEAKARVDETEGWEKFWVKFNQSFWASQIVVNSAHFKMPYQDLLAEFEQYFENSKR